MKKIQVNQVKKRKEKKRGEKNNKNIFPRITVHSLLKGISTYFTFLRNSQVEIDRV